MVRWDSLWVNVSAATMAPGAGADAYGGIPDAAIAVANGKIAWIGPRAELPAEEARSTRHVHDCGGTWITPGLIDCHTHLVFGGDRAGEFELRLGGASYEEIARAGGGIRSTVAATRAVGEDGLFAAAVPRLRRLLGEGVTTVEIKSGYGLDTANEMKMLRVARRLGREMPVDVATTFLGAHALPPEYEGRQGAYVDLVCDEMMPRIAADKLADATDAFCEKIAFTPAETERVFAASARAGIPVKLHADQLSDLGGAALAARHKALSAEHLEYTSEAGAAAMGRAGTVAVLLPGAFFVLRETKLPPIAALRQHGVPIAIASDCNPGSSPALSLLLMLNMACTLFRLTPAEALAGVTRNAARALGMGDRGTLEVGKRADLALWRIGRPAELAYWLGGNPCIGVVRRGEEVAMAEAA
ncbi:MAG: imidazolonepropionase [Alphaproteobacteria bacterium]|nr:imidazolonepropionase [Alphaproteobacteria bacterium]